MTDETQAVPEGAQNTPDFTSCPDWGTGGQFTYDQVTGLRTRVVPPQEAVEALTSASSDAEAPAEQPAPVTKKEKARA